MSEKATVSRTHHRAAISVERRHECEPPDDHGWRGWHCPTCDTHWILDLSYKGPGWRHPVYSLVRDD